MKTAAQAREAKSASKANVEAMLSDAKAQAQQPDSFMPKGRRSRKPNTSVKKLSDVSRKVEKITHQRELPKELLDRFVKAIQNEYPDIGFNHPKSDEKVLAHYRCPGNHRRTPNWPFILSTGANRFYFDEETGEVFVGDNNTI